MVEGFLLGLVVAFSLVAAVFFFKFWKRSRDSLFLAFGVAFLIEGLNRTSYLFLDNPNEGAPGIYIVRLVAFLLILAAIIRKNAVRAG